MGKNIEVGDNSRIDDFAVLSAGPGGISIGRYVHVAAQAMMIGAGRMEMHDFSTISGGVAVYASTDDFSGAAMTNPCLPADLTNVRHEPVIIGRHCVVGAHTVILPGVTMHEGSAVGAMSLVKHDCRPFVIYAGTPAEPIKERKRDFLELEKRAFPN